MPKGPASRTIIYLLLTIAYFLPFLSLGRPGAARGRRRKVQNIFTSLTVAAKKMYNGRKGVRPMLHKYLDTVNVLRIFDLLDDAIQIVDKYGNIIYYNTKMATLDKIPAGMMEGRRIEEVYPSLNEENSSFYRAIRSGASTLNYRHSYTNLSGQVIESISTTMPLVVRDEIVGAVEIAHITPPPSLGGAWGGGAAIDMNQIFEDNQPAEQRRRMFTFLDIIGQTQKIQHLKRIAEKTAYTPSPVIIHGETGTGKEMFAQAIHSASGRYAGPFVAQNCGALPNTLVESIFFGTTRGSFTGAEEKPGLFEMANGGTLFLDEINSMDKGMQAKLLRVLEDGTVRRLGSDKDREVDVKVVAAMNISPDVALEEKLIRDDLYYRLNVVSLDLPPLRKRKSDIPLLVEYLLNQLNRQLESKIQGVEPEVMQCFKQHHWPGNVRELRNVLESAMNIAEHQLLQLQDLPGAFRAELEKAEGHSGFEGIAAGWELADEVDYHQFMAAGERQYIQNVLEKNGGNVSAAARALGLSRQALQYKMKKLEIR